MKKSISIGIDIGSISVKIAVFLPKDSAEALFISRLEQHGYMLPSEACFQLDKACVLLSRYRRHHGQPMVVLSALLDKLYRIIPKERVDCIYLTGSSGRHYQKTLGFQYINEYQALAKGVSHFYPEVRTLFEMGGESSKFMRIDGDSGRSVQILDYECNGECAAGTGSFFDQQVERLKYRIEDAGSVIQKAGKTAHIAGRCSVFAKSDMIHAQQRGYAPPEILKGLSEAVVRNFKGTITKGKSIEPVVALVGGVSMNKGVVDAFRNVFDLEDGRMIIPARSAWMGALGAALAGRENGQCAKPDLSVPAQMIPEYPAHEPLSMGKVVLLRNRVKVYPLQGRKEVPAYLGVDIGSVSTNLALLTADGQFIHGIYRMTDGRPIDVVRTALQEMFAFTQDRVHITGIGTTGSGRELIGALIGADVVKDEITAHKTGAVHMARSYLNRDVDTIFEVGGQDSKFISLQNGVVVDFALNEACAAGTGSFLEEQAGQLGISIKNEFAHLAMQSRRPLKLGERCTVFIEKELGPYLQQGVKREDIVAGLAYSVVLNYLNRVVKKRKIGETIFFQGGTAYNDSVAAAFATLLNKEIIVPPQNGVMGAIGAALLARDKMSTYDKAETRFRGWDLSHVDWRIKEISCVACSNRCVVQEFEVEGEKLYWGDKCSDRFRQRTKTDHSAQIDDLIQFRENLIFQDSLSEINRTDTVKGKIGIPRILYFHDRYPFWKAYIEHIGFQPVLSEPSRNDVINKGIELAVAEPCFPVQAAQGHIMALFEKNVDYVLVPHVLNEEDPTDSVASFVCPWGQTIPLICRANPQFADYGERILMPTVPFRENHDQVERKIFESLSVLDISRRENRKAVEAAYRAQDQFRKQIADKRKAVWDYVLENRLPCVVLAGRPYNIFDSGLNLNIPAKLRSQYGIDVIPIEFLPHEHIDIRDIHDHMFWNYGRHIIQAARVIRDFTFLHLIYISNFKCGPDSYIRHFVSDAAGEPFLMLQFDSHANDAGVMTRIEAFLESKGMI